MHIGHSNDWRVWGCVRIVIDRSEIFASAVHMLLARSSLCISLPSTPYVNQSQCRCLLAAYYTLSSGTYLPVELHVI